MTNLQSLAITGVLLIMVTTTTTVFISDGLSLYSSSGDVSDSKLAQLENLTTVSATQLSDTAQTEAGNVQPKASFFTLPGLVNTFGIVFQIIPVLEAFAGTMMGVLGLNRLPVVVQGVFAIIGIVVSFTFARRILG